MSIFGSMFNGAGLGHSALTQAQISNVYRQHQAQMMQNQMQYSPGQIIEISTQDRSSIYYHNWGTTKARRDCKNCGAPARPVCDYCGS